MKMTLLLLFVKKNWERFVLLKHFLYALMKKKTFNRRKMSSNESWQIPLWIIWKKIKIFYLMKHLLIH
uniref:Uncharacterized protein n=1 Tax=Meloidogyne enterolobii TaxID=390850 RepID=A0A6V7X1F1_MELEN|nr:unnamed protein product [Meloidogyne enterolobii]